MDKNLSDFLPFLKIGETVVSINVGAVFVIVLIVWLHAAISRSEVKVSKD